MADIAAPLIAAALSRAAAEPAGAPLFGRKGTPGLFSATAAGKRAAQRCKDEGFLQTVRTETRGKTARDICAITDKGISYLLGEVSPKHAIEDFIRALDARQTQADELLDTARQMQSSLASLQATAQKVLNQVREPISPPAPAVSTNGTCGLKVDLMPLLMRWQQSGASEDCPLPELFRQARQTVPHLTIGQFHDTLRQLHDQERIYLHPWTGPLYAIPEAPYALLVGHEIGYYASARTGNGEEAKR